ncbi:protein tweety-2 [Ischnura elegans]|uniref:protein tweety-2 n=1 Tax=Ischnura elegans TaxID=197161 RepID=UPI001ED86A5B|nr:protein tweety-2 [Ischnura elegans]
MSGDGSAAGGAQEDYSPPLLAWLFHSLPHLNIALRSVNSTFNPASEAYLEALGILASLPAAWLILSLFVLLIYLLTRCCERHPRRKRSIAALKWTLAIFTLLCCGAVALGLYGNDDVHNGLVQFVAAVRGAHAVVHSVVNQSSALESSVNGGLRPQVSDAMASLERVSAPMNASARSALLALVAAAARNTTTASAAAAAISAPLRQLGSSLERAAAVTELAEAFRWPVTMAVLSVLLVFCIILLFGVARHSRCALITFSVFGLFAVIVSWLLASLYLASSVALGDLCVAPAPYLEQRAAAGASTAIEAAVQARLAHFYLRCEQTPIAMAQPVPTATLLSSGGRASPLTPRLRDAQRSLLAVEELVALASRMAPGDVAKRLEALTSALDRSRRLANMLPPLLDCRNLHRHYVHAAKSICDLGLYGLAFMLLSCLTAGFFFTVLVWVDSHTWIYIRKRDGREAKQSHHHHHHGERSQRAPPGGGSGGGTGTRGGGRGGSHAPSAPLAPSDGAHASSSAGPSAALMLGPNNGQYPTLSKQCKTLESADFY